jgi:CBS domain-containing protein
VTAGICWAYVDDRVEKAVEIMSDKQMRRLPIIDRDKRLVGIVALGDLAVERSEMKSAAKALWAISKP